MDTLWFIYAIAVLCFIQGWRFGASYERFRAGGPVTITPRELEP